MLKLADVSHVELVAQLVHKFVDEEVPWDTPDTEVILDSVYKVLSSPLEQSVGLLSFSPVGDPKGMLLATVAPSMFSRKVSTIELAFYIQPQFRDIKLASEFLTAYETWSKEIVKADYCCLACLDDRVAKLYKRRGYTRSEQSFIKRIK